uniref:Uncharacterized protein n=1 Tax=Gorilla gorilla gorilla TaxID=9595 RepID=A0A2I2Z6R2_GORGO
MCLGEEVLETHPTHLESHGIHLACFVEVSTVNLHTIIIGFFCYTSASGKGVSLMQAEKFRDYKV